MTVEPISDGTKSSQRCRQMRTVPHSGSSMLQHLKGILSKHKFLRGQSNKEKHHHLEEFLQCNGRRSHVGKYIRINFRISHCVLSFKITQILLSCTEIRDFLKYFYLLHKLCYQKPSFICTQTLQWFEVSK